LRPASSRAHRSPASRFGGVKAACRLRGSGEPARVERRFDIEAAVHDDIVLGLLERKIGQKPHRLLVDRRRRQAPAQTAPLMATAQNGQAMQTYVSDSNRTTWMFPPIGKYLAQ
jgi:hypothetical protein